QPEPFKSDHTLPAVRQQHHLLDPEIDQDLGADAVVAQLAAGRLDRLAGAPALLGEHDGRRLADQHHHAPALLGDVAHRGLDLATAAGVTLTQAIGEDVDGVTGHRDGPAGRGVPLHQRDVLGHRHLVDVDHAPEVAAVDAFERRLAKSPHDRIVAPAIGDQVGDGADLEPVTLGETDEVVATGHGPVVVHDLADHARRRDPGQPR